MPEYFPGAYDEFILDVTTAHPQMMELFGKVLGERFVHDHCLMLNHAPSSPGRHWHGHPYLGGSHEVEDPIGTGKALTKEFLQEQCVRTLCYPEGTDDAEGGDFAIIPGAHLYRIPFKWSTKRPDDDDDMRRNWLPGKTHAYTGEPLEIKHLSLSPGSMVSFVHHLPHHVGHRQPDACVRWGLLMAHRNPNPTASPSKWSSGVPTHWAERMETAGTIAEAARRVCVSRGQSGLIAQTTAENAPSSIRLATIGTLAHLPIHNLLLGHRVNRIRILVGEMPWCSSKRHTACVDATECRLPPGHAETRDHLRRT